MCWGTPDQQTPLSKASTHLSNEDDLLRVSLNKNLYLDKILCGWSRLVCYYIDLQNQRLINIQNFTNLEKLLDINLVDTYACYL